MPLFDLSAVGSSARSSMGVSSLRGSGRAIKKSAKMAANFMRGFGMKPVKLGKRKR